MPIFFELYLDKKKLKRIEFKNYYFIYKKMLENFVSLIKQKKYLSKNRDYELCKIVLAGEISKRKGGKAIHVDSL